MQKLIFVYNAKSGPIQAGYDFFHKIISPETYACNLCTITHGIFTERAKWKAFRKNENVEMKFYYKDEFENEFGQKFNYPVILIMNTELEVLLTNDKINELETVEALIGAVGKQLKMQKP